MRRKNKIVKSRFMWASDLKEWWLRKRGWVVEDWQITDEGVLVSYTKWRKE